MNSCLLCALPLHVQGILQGLCASDSSRVRENAWGCHGWKGPTECNVRIVPNRGSHALSEKALTFRNPMKGVYCMRERCYETKNLRVIIIHHRYRPINERLTFGWFDTQLRVIDSNLKGAKGTG